MHRALLSSEVSRRRRRKARLRTCSSIQMALYTIRWRSTELFPSNAAATTSMLGERARQPRVLQGRSRGDEARALRTSRAGRRCRCPSRSRQTSREQPKSVRDGRCQLQAPPEALLAPALTPPARVYSSMAVHTFAVIDCIRAELTWPASPAPLAARTLPRLAPPSWLHVAAAGDCEAQRATARGADVRSSARSTAVLQEERAISATLHRGAAKGSCRGKGH